MTGPGSLSEAWRRQIKRAVISVLVTVAVLAFGAAPALASDVEHFHFHAGPYTVYPGGNLILLDTNHVPRPAEDGYLTRFAPNLHYALPNGACCGAVPRVDVIHLHHGVWLTTGTAGQGEGNGYAGQAYPFFAVGEEKTITTFPSGYGYPVGKNDLWVLNYMLHDLTNKGAKVYITYDVDFVPMSSPLAASITPVHPIWMDVRDHEIYPVFDVLRGSGKNGKFTYPDMAANPYGGGPPANEFTVDHPGTLIGTAGHLHPGGLYDDLELIRSGATPSGGAIPGAEPGSVRLFRSQAHYFGNRPPVSWDMAMTATPADWRARVNAGDVLRVSATYETQRASWYESMGIMVAWEAWNDQTGVDPFTHALDENGQITHGHLPENNHYGGTISLGTTAQSYPSCFRKKVVIQGFKYEPGDFNASGGERCTPTVHKGHALTFVNLDANPQSSFSLFNPPQAYLGSTFHSVTGCQTWCELNTGISYPLANGTGNIDSGQLGLGLPAVGRLSWSTPTNLAPGTYTFFCRIHPFMRGVFRVVR
jgi:hypothetical protein